MKFRISNQKLLFPTYCLFTPNIRYYMGVSNSIDYIFGQVFQSNLLHEMSSRTETKALFHLILYLTKPVWGNNCTGPFHKNELHAIKQICI